MRPCYKKLGQEPLPPFYENLVFWAPLTEGDLTDHISGVEPTTGQNCIVTWDSNKISYLIDASAAGDLVYGLLWEHLSLNLVDGHEATIYVEVCYSKGTYNSSSFFAGVPNILSDAETQSSNYVAVQPIRFSLQPSSTFVKLVCSCPTLDGVNVKNPAFYKNGSLFVTGNWRAKSKLSRNVVCAVQNYHSSISAYIRDIRIYNRALTAEEVAQL